ncbi:hypothetical protein [Mycobacterium phage WXIN]|nr:hypothetical protein [Mycobacterium phage WXIN]
MSVLRRRTDGRLEVADNRQADTAHGCMRDQWCILAHGHAGECNEEREYPA